MDKSRLNKLLSIILLASMLAVPVTCFAIPQKGKPAPPIQVVTTSGQKITLANYKGYVLVVEFFATWCEGCKDSLPHLINYNKQYGKQGLQILGLNPGVRGDSVDVVRQFMREKQINFPVALVDDDLLIDYGISPIPAIFIIDKKGVLVQKFVGFTPEIKKEMEATIKSLLVQ
ncbi:TlpA family protein disulfide reductase [bacterium]|nr:TlpA family protein disulfide reductase [bacterium]